MSGHAIVWTFDRDNVRPKVVCNEPVGATCRLEPIQDSVLCHCEAWVGPLFDEDGPYHVAESSLGEEKHRMQDGGECNVELFLNESMCIEESSADKPNFEIARTPFEPVWEGEYYSWRLLPNAAEATP